MNEFGEEHVKFKDDENGGSSDQILLEVIKLLFKERKIEASSPRLFLLFKDEKPVHHRRVKKTRQDDKIPSPRYTNFVRVGKEQQSW